MRSMRLKAFLAARPRSIAVFVAFAVFVVSSGAPAVLIAQDQTVRIHVATILDGPGGVLRNATIGVQGSTIAAIDTSNAGAGANVTYDLGALTVMPGMIDVHVHVGWHFDKDCRSAARGARPRRTSCTAPRMRTSR